MRILRIIEKEERMPTEKTVTASEFARNFGRYRDEATAGDVVTVTNRGRVVGGFLSARRLEEYRRLKRRERENLVVGELPDDVIADIEAAEYDKAP
jgi:prevent-host-death family protein